MSRQTVIAASLAAALLGVFIWLWLASVRSSNETALLVDGEAGVGSVALTKDAQSPILTQETPEPDGTEPQKQTAEASEADTGPYKFETWQDAAGHLAELMGLRYDELLAAGKDSKTARIQAYNTVRQRIFYDNEDPALKAALLPYLPASDNASEEERKRSIPLSEYGSVEFLVRAGRLSQSALKQGSLSLPNGGRYYFDKNEEVIVRWQKWTIAAETEHGKIMLASYLKARTHWEAELASPSGDPRADKMLRWVQKSIEEMKTPQLQYYEKSTRIRPPEWMAERERRRLAGLAQVGDASPSAEAEGYDPNPQPSSPELKLTVLELGVIDE